MEKEKFVYLKIYLSDLEIIEKNIPPDVAAKVIFAAGDYMKDGTVRDIPSEGALAFAMLQQQIDRAKEAYQDLSKTRAEAGAKGGRAKAARSKEKAIEKKFRHPTKAEVKRAVDRLSEDEDLSDVDDYDIDAFYDELNDGGWKVGGTSFQCRQDWEDTVYARFCGNETCTPYEVFYPAFAHCFGKYNGLRDENGKSCARDAVADFFESYGKKSHTWRVGELVKTDNGLVGAYKEDEWEPALDAFLTTWKQS